MSALPCPRLELRWEPIHECCFDEETKEICEKKSIPIPYYNWRCDYSLVLPLQSGDIRSIDDATELRLPINSTKCQNYGNSPINKDGEVNCPYRVGKHIKWDNTSLGGHLPMVAVCGDRVTVISIREE